MEARNASFQRLKPACIALSQATLTFSAHKRNGKEVTACLEGLTEVLDALARRPDTLDNKLADYVFFPISQVLKAGRDLPVRAMELCLRCLAILILKGWRENITPSLSSQLVIFLSLTCDSSGKTIAVSQVTDELRIAAFLCMSNLFESLYPSTAGKSSLTSASNVPSLGHAISVILDGVSDGESFEVQSAAGGALLALLRCIEDVQVLSSFFPGIVSLLTKVLTPSTQNRRHWKIIVQSLQILENLTCALLSNEVVAILQDDLGQRANADTTKRLDSSWVKATASQIKIALANVEKLRSHSRPEVREGLASLNLAILDDCGEALDNCCSLTLEGLLMLLEHDSTSAYAERARLEVLVRSRPAIAATMASVFHDELLSLTRIMQSNDDHAKERTLRQVFSAYSMLAGADSDVRLLSRMLGAGLRDSITTILQSSSNGTSKLSQGHSLVLTDIPMSDGDQGSSSFPAPLAKHKGQNTLFSCIESHLKATKDAHRSLRISAELVPAIRNSTGDVQVANFWLVLRDLQAADSTSDVLNSFLVIVDESSGQNGSVREQLYAFSLDIMIDADSDWRLQTLALETIAMQAQQHKEEFRVELVDALYPILHHMGSEVTQVRSHAITCLNIVSDACGYSDVKDLVVSNVDYLVNAVALKLNAFDVSPQGPQVLLMMVRLAGPSLLPYLEDTLECIFAALEDYHGYPTLVALLFAVLKTIAEEGVKSPQLQLTLGDQISNGTISMWTPTTVKELLVNVKRLAAKSENTNDSDLPENVPQQPWKELDLSAELDKTQEIGAQEDEEAEAEELSSSEQAPPPAPKTYALLLKITQLTQHYLSSSSPSLRISLLTLIRTTIPALAKHESSYLPLINTLWPEISSRLFDDEPHVVSASLQIIATMCEYAGEFMRTRIAALWPEIVSMYRRIAREHRAQHGGGGKGGGARSLLDPPTAQMTLRHTEAGYVDVSDRAVWRRLNELLMTVVKFVGIEAQAFEDVLDMLRPLRSLEPDFVAVLEEYNSDAVWLALHREGPHGMERTRVQSTGDWKFVELVQ